jgi:hypothetical protein
VYSLSAGYRAGKNVLSVYKNRMVLFVDSEFLIIEFHLAHVHDIIISVYQHVNLRAVNIVVTF